jgi:ATP phosphoribosyltransferase
MKIALTKGYLLKPSIALLRNAGIDCPDAEEISRKLTFKDRSGLHDFVLIRPADVPVYVEHGAVDIGITGKDVLLESEASVAELVDLKFGGCKLVIAVPKEDQHKPLVSGMRVATKFVHTTTQYFKTLDLNVEIIKLYGSVELAPLVGLSDAIADLTATGTTLAENGLVIQHTIVESTARLVANKVKLKTNFDAIMALATRLKTLVAESSSLS